MAEYIERNKVIQLLLDACSECKDGCMEFDGFLPDCTQCVIGKYKVEISRLPVADVQPVKHGKWKQTGGKYSRRKTIDRRILTCSVCGNVLYMEGVNAGRGDANYCPNCGARMDGDI